MTESEHTRDLAALQRLPETDTPSDDDVAGPGCVTTGVDRVTPRPDTDRDQGGDQPEDRDQDGTG